MADDGSLGSPLWYVQQLDKSLKSRALELEMYDKYADGEHRLMFSGTKFRQAFGGLFAPFADNWCELIIDAVDERLNVEGFRQGMGDDATADDDAWGIWQANNLDNDSSLAHTDALTGGRSFALVWGDSDGNPVITVESPRQMAVMTSPANRRQRLAAFKRWTDVDGKVYGTLWLPGGVYKYVSDSPTSTTDWKQLSIKGESWPLPNPLKVVPVVPLINKAKTLRADGRSEIHNAIPIQDAVNKLCADLLVASEYAAFPQRWVTGYELEIDDEGNAKEPWKIALDKLMVAESENVKFGQFDAGDLGNYVKAIEMFVQHLASQSRTPPHYFYLSGDFPSGDAIKSAETGLVAKSRRKMRGFGEAWEEVMRLAFAVMDDPRAGDMSNETIWGDPEYRSESERADALVKRAAIGVPEAQLWEDAGYSPQQIARFKAERASDALLAASLAASQPQLLPPMPTNVQPS